MRDVLLVTCGTSLVNNLRRENPAPRNVLAWLEGLGPKNRKCGAEINSIAMMSEEYESQVSPLVICLYCSETADGRETAEILEGVLPRLFPGVTVETRIIEHLNPDRPAEFRRKGLKGLLAALASDARLFGTTRTVINATGGLKVMVALAQSLAQAMQIPSYYKFEHSPEGLMVPPMPLEFDLGLWLRLQDGLRVLDTEGLLEENDFIELTENLTPQDREKLLVMLEETQITEDTDSGARKARLFALSPLGSLFLETGRFRFWNRQKQLLPREVPETEKATKVQHPEREGHSQPFEARYGLGDRLLMLPYVSYVRVHYFNPEGPPKCRCHIKDPGRKVLEVEWGNGKGLIKYKLDLPTARDEEQLLAAAAAINDKIQEWR